MNNCRSDKNNIICSQEKIFFILFLLFNGLLLYKNALARTKECAVTFDLHSIEYYFMQGKFNSKKNPHKMTLENLICFLTA